jgi:3-phosphoshikimate 1-carboxyvinyltransferase
MKKSIKPSTIKGTVTAPASKSMMQRAIAAALLADSPMRISNPTYSNDSNAALSVIQALGATVVKGQSYIDINGSMNPTGETLVFGESGLGIRMFSPIAALYHKPLTLTGEGSLLKRPISMIIQPLQDLGVNVTTNNGFPPLTVTGPLKGGQSMVDGSVSSQQLTGLLMALPMAQGDSHLKVIDLKSTPYIDMTLKLLQRFNIEVSHHQYRDFHIKGDQVYHCDSGHYYVEGDWSGAAFLLAAGAVGGSVSVTGLDTESPQADRKFMEALIAAGADVNISSDRIDVQKKNLKHFQFDATHCPDLFPPLVALACNCEGTSIITGVERLAHKESNRAHSLQKEFNTLGGDVQVKGNQMHIKGQKLKGGAIDSHNDHRIAMAGAIAAINAENTVHIHDAMCAAKSYPAFFEDLQIIGGEVDE